MKHILSTDARELTRDITDNIITGKWSSGTRLPSLRHLAAEYGQSLSMVQRGIHDLVQRGLLAAHPGKGVFVAGGDLSSCSTSGKFHVGVLADSNRFSNSYTAKVLSGIQEATSRADVTLHCSLNLAYGYPEFSLPVLIRQIREISSYCQAMIFIGCYDTILNKLPFQLPAVGVEMNCRYHGQLSPISLDTLDAADQAAGFFRERAPLGVTAYGADTPLHRARLRAFQAVCPVPFTPAPLVPLGNPLQPQLPPEGHGLFFAGGHLANRVAAHFRKQTGRRLIDAYAVLSLDGKSRQCLGFEPLNTIYPDWREAGRVALGEAIRRIQYPGCSALRIGLGTTLEIIDR